MTPALPLRLVDQPHHDGAPLCVDPSPRTLGATVRVRLRVPDTCGTERVRLRSTPDAEPAVIEASIQRRANGITWWQADLLLHNPVTAYRWLLDGGELGRCWVNGAGVFHRDVTDDADFRLTATPPEPGSPGALADAAPAWLADTVGYQIFIDRFADSGTDRNTPHWALPRAWHEPVENTPGLRSRHWYGGDLAGIEAHLDHLATLGVTLIYLTPFFPAGSMHRYDASTFDHVDPALGGDGALESLVAAAHARGLRVIGDLTLNHTGVRHEWFTTAMADPDAAERSYYFFDDTEPDGYVAWHGVPTLPKLDHRSSALQQRFYDGDGSVVARYLEEPFALDGWRIDCANTTARFRDHDDNHHVARRTRATMDRIGRSTDRDTRWLVAEHCYDAADDLDGTGWHGVMAYQWFTRPLWAWLKAPGPIALMSAVELIDLDGHGLVESMRHLAANVSWNARQASMTMIDSHDTARFRTVVGGDVTRHVVGLTALFTMPGVPTLFAGSELGCEGDSMDTARVPFPWDRLASEHDAADSPGHSFTDSVQQLIAIRRRSEALRYGSMRWIDATEHSITYIRETAGSSVLVHLVRSPCERPRFLATEIGSFDNAGAPDRCSVQFGDPELIEFQPSEGDTPGSITLPGAPGAYVVACGPR